MGRTLDQHLDVLVAAIAAIAPDKVKVQAHPGRFDLKELDRYALQAPCILVTLLEFIDRDGSMPGGNAKFEAYILTKDGRLDPSKHNLTIGSVLVAACKGAVLAHEDASAPSRPRYLNLYNSPAGDRGVVLGSVSWQQQLELAMAETPDAPADFKLLHVDYDFAPADQVIDNQQDITLQA